MMSSTRDDVMSSTRDDVVMLRQPHFLWTRQNRKNINRDPTALRR
jgi:hypothetical protein